MDSSTGPSLIWGVTMIVVLIASLAARRLPLGQVLRNALAWVAIFVGVYALFLFRGEIAAVWHRAVADLGGAQQAQVSGDAMSLRRTDGHFFVDAKVNGQSVRFLVDSGATVTSISPETAAAVGLDVDRTGFPMVVSTANGLANTWPAHAEEISVGTISVPAVDVLVSEQRDSENLLGMNWLNRLSAWEVRGETMILRP